MKTLGLIATLGGVEGVLTHARTQHQVTTIQPHILLDDDGGYLEIILPDDERYPHEIYR